MRVADPHPLHPLFNTEVGMASPLAQRGRLPSIDIGIIAEIAAAVKPGSGSSGKAWPAASRLPKDRAVASIRRKLSSIKLMKEKQKKEKGAASCQFGFDRGTPGSLVGFSGSLVEIDPHPRVRSSIHRVRSQVFRPE